MSRSVPSTTAAHEPAMGFDESLAAARREVSSGDLGAAALRLDRLHREVCRQGRSDLADLAFASLAAVQLELPNQLLMVPKLRALLGTSRSPMARYLAAQALTRHYCSQSRTRHALFYARLAVHLAPDDRYASARHTLGISLLASSAPMD